MVCDKSFGFEKTYICSGFIFGGGGSGVSYFGNEACVSKDIYCDGKSIILGQI